MPVFAVIVLSFLGATAYAQWRMHAIDTAAVAIAEETSPALTRLATARGEMRQLQHLARAYVLHGPGTEPFDPSPYETARHGLGEQIDEYLGLPVQGDRATWSHILKGRARLDEELGRFEAEAEHGSPPHAVAHARAVLSTADDLDGAITASVAVEAARAHALALEISSVRTRTTLLAFALDLLCVIIAGVAAVRLRGALRSHADLIARHQRLHEERASEMEQFAGRVAHDILSPLGTVGFALELATRPDVDDAQRRQVGARGANALERVKRLVNGLLRFARAGAKPDADAAADVGSTVADLVTDLVSEAAEAGADLRVEIAGSPLAACDAGVLTSLVANLARNAIKYIGDGPVRQITIRALEKGAAVRVEVSDTGPGLPPGLEGLVFEPYVRAHSGKPGIGLGLATVKRIAEAHGGRVGVRSTPGQGCTFWFELPRATGAGVTVSAAPTPSGVIARKKAAG